MAFFSRGKNKIQSPDNMSTIYNKYIEDKTDNSPYNVDRHTFMAISDMFYATVCDNILKGEEFVMPTGLGKIAILKSKIKNYKSNAYSIDWPATVALGKQVYHLNEHSNGYNYSFKWLRKDRVKNNRLYRFTPTRNLKRTLAHIIKNREFDYFERK